ncbi:5-methyltetrahydropteroyltriglutamate--homocysteine methyltransferase [Actinokineospora sp.]|uniref:5-methyltetrahydropteroyltriglutamate-- homocysteine methyltransferase n=1 Tax=Actinokineospora sp. TaxID=1872133 RepID=UPI004037C765
MSDYDPRTSTGIPTEPVGSLPRPSKLQEAYAAYDEGSIDHDALEEMQDAAAKESIERYEATGSPIVSDGEQRWSSFATYPITDTLAGTGLADTLAGGGQYFAIFADGHRRQLPKLAKGPFKYKTYAADTLKKSIGYATKPMKQAVIAPSMLALLYPLDDEVPGYAREKFLEDLCNETEKDIRGAFAAGAARVSIDFTEGRLSTRNDPRNPWTGRNMLPHFIELNNRVIDRFTAEERAKIGVHTCPGGDRDSVHSADVDYNDLLPSMFQMNAGYFLIQLASERDKDKVYKSIGEHLRSDANGIPQFAYIGVINPLNPRVESPEEVRDALVRASNFMPKEQLGATDDCGFSPFSIDEKPSHGSPDFARDVAFQKITNRVKGTRMAADQLKVS